MKLFDIIDFGMTDFFDILLVSIFFYYAFFLFLGTRAVQMFFGFSVLMAFYGLSQWWDLQGVSFLFSNLFTVGVVAIVIVFQPEIRGALTRLGQTASHTTIRHLLFHQDAMNSVIDSLVITCRDFSRSRWGALIVLEQDVGLKPYIDTGIRLDAKVSSALLKSIFYPNARLHDGAVILHRDRVSAAACTLPIAASTGEEKQTGMRHRSAETLAGESDAVIIVVSEETGQISLYQRRKLLKGLQEHELREELNQRLLES